MEKLKLPKLMTGSLWFVSEYEDGTEPSSLKEFKDNINTNEPPEKLSRGNIIPKNEKVEQYVIFECFRPQYKEAASFRLYLYNDGKAVGKVEYAKDYFDGKEPFEGRYKKISNSKIVIWGIWYSGVNLKEKFFAFIELSK